MIGGKLIQYQNDLKWYTFRISFTCISNNLAENSIRPFTIGRKNWLFSGSPKGAAASAAVYSIIETAKANGLDPYKYLHFILKNLPGAQFHRHPEFLEDYLPWNPEVQQICKQ